jgi:hypothetical protein
MNLAIISIIILLAICSWILQGEKKTHLEINEMISLIERLEQQKALHAQFQCNQSDSYLRRKNKV